MSFLLHGILFVLIFEINLEIMFYNAKNQCCLLCLPISHKNFVDCLQQSNAIQLPGLHLLVSVVTAVALLLLPLSFLSRTPPGEMPYF